MFACFNPTTIVVYVVQVDPNIGWVVILQSRRRTAYGGKGGGEEEEEERRENGGRFAITFLKFKSYLT